MAIVRVTEYGDVRNGMAYRAPVAKHVLTTSGTSAAVTIGVSGNAVRVDTDGIIAFDVNTAAVATGPRMPANHVEYFLLQPGDTFNMITAT